MLEHTGPQQDTPSTAVAAVARLLVVLGLVMLSGSLISGWQSSAQEAARAVASVSIASTPGGTSHATLDLALLATRPAGAGHVRGVVRIRAAGTAVEVGRFSLAPGQDSAAQRYRFDISAAVRQLDLSRGPIEVEVALADRSAATAAITIVNAQIATR